MLRVLALIRRLPTIDRKAFREHYEERHVVVARPLLRHLVRYARHHVEEELVGAIDFDVITSFGYPDLAAVEGMFATLASEAAGPILEDERRFMDKPGNRFFEVSERPWPLASGQGAEEDRSTFVLVARPPAMSQAECSSRLLRDVWPALLEKTSAPRFAVVRDAFPMRGAPLPYDGLMQLAGDEGIDFRGFANRMERDGFRVAAIRTRRFETKLPAE